MAEPLREFTLFIWWMSNGAKRPPTQDQARPLMLWVHLYRLPETTPTIAIIIIQPESWYSFDRPTEGRRLSRPSWLVTYRDGLPVRRRSPIRVLTGSDVAQLRWSRPTRNGNNNNKIYGSLFFIVAIAVQTRLRFHNNAFAFGSYMLIFDRLLLYTWH